MHVIHSPRTCFQFVFIALIALVPPLLSIHALGQSDTAKIDHIRILVRDIAEAQTQYRNTLGFDLSRTEPLIYSEGSAHNGAALSDGIYLELLGVADREKLVQARPWIVDFLQEHQGGHSVGLIVTSARDVADHLRARGVEAPIQNLVGSHPGAPPILLVTPTLLNLPNGSIFFVQYPYPQPLKEVIQPNTTEGLVAVWIVVKDLEKASNESEALGFHLARRVNFPSLGARGRELETGRGKIVLLEADSANKPAAKFLRDRGPGLMGFTVAVGDLAKAHALIEEKAKRKLRVYQGVYGRSFLVTPELTSGVWIEMARNGPAAR
jgi:catechol 2,3-dioxygenase-like lactoylglutathione lyase family enzyme